MTSMKKIVDWAIKNGKIKPGSFRFTYKGERYAGDYSPYGGYIVINKVSKKKR